MRIYIYIYPTPSALLAGISTYLCTHACMLSMTQLHTLHNASDRPKPHDRGIHVQWGHEHVCICTHEMFAFRTLTRGKSLKASDHRGYLIETLQNYFLVITGLPAFGFGRKYQQMSLNSLPHISREVSTRPQFRKEYNLKQCLGNRSLSLSIYIYIYTYI